MNLSSLITCERIFHLNEYRTRRVAESPKLPPFGKNLAACDCIDKERRDDTIDICELSKSCLTQRDTDQHQAGA